MDAKKLEAVRSVKERLATLMPKGVDVIGVGIGLSGSNPALKVNLRTRPTDKTVLPKVIEGVPVIYDFVGKITSR
jgi:hypothetical protein